MVVNNLIDTIYSVMIFVCKSTGYQLSDLYKLVKNWGDTLLIIYLKNGRTIEIPEFKEIKYSWNAKNVINKDNLDELSLGDSITYLFAGKYNCVVKGEEIQYLEFI